jgi:hypothetical protein
LRLTQRISVTITASSKSSNLGKGVQLKLVAKSKKSKHRR